MSQPRNRKLTVHGRASRADSPLFGAHYVAARFADLVVRNLKRHVRTTVGWIVGSRPLQFGKCALRHGNLPERRKLR